MNINRNILIFFWTIAVLAVAQTSRAQTIPGRWYKVALPQASRIANDNTMDFGFADSLNGICLSDKGLISSTTDGGRTWVLDTDLKKPIVSKYNLNSVVCTAPHRGFFHGLSIAPGATKVLSVPNVNEPNDGIYTILAEKMYDTAYGFRLVEYLDQETQSQYQDSVVIIETHDGWQSASVYGSAYIISPDSALNQVTAQPMYIGYIVDSNDIWAEEGRNYVWTGGTTYYNEPKIILHTSNGGVTWQSFDAFDSSRYKQQWVQDFLVNPKTREVFCTVNYSTIDFAYSSDYGQKWQVDSTYGNRLWRLANPAPGILWAMISEGGSPSIEVFPPRDAYEHSNDYSRKLAYSSDNGAHWLIDSTTFINDSLEEMHWLDARHGWVASWSHDSLFMWYYDADGNAGVVDHYLTNPFEFMVYPNPARNWVTVDGNLGNVAITDALGRIWRCPHNGNQFNITQLPPGSYFVSSNGHHARFLKE